MARLPAAERSAELIDAAVRVIAQQGVAGATTRRIAEEANAPLATLHYCFATKELLFAAVFRHVAARYQQVLVDSDVHGDLKSTAHELLRGLLVWYMANADFARATIELISWAQRQVGGQAKSMYREVTETTRSILAAAASTDGRAISTVLISEITYVFSALSDGFALNWMVFTDESVADVQVTTTLAVFDTWIDTRLDRPVLSDRDAITATEPPREASPTSMISWVRVG